ncbi:protein NTM1-like 9 [Punica granatum]|uniref:Protein NTM1-like 9 n=1 Tax=Punica granatum TaxID=22663 RepID=A0A6P8DIE2_PUNGR|nr:protein NTM1-like 9 [Punica granatum]
MESMMWAAMKSLPVGYRFHPTDQELLCHYLYRKNIGLEESVCVIPEVDICRYEPPELPRKFRESSIVESKDPEWWFFCEQELGRTPRRSTNGGYWKKTGGTRDLRSSNGKEVIGSKKFLTFFQGNSSKSTKTDWVMHENHLLTDFPGLVQGNRKNYVLCMIKCNSYEKANSSPSHEYEQDEPMSINIAGILEPDTDNGFIPEICAIAAFGSSENAIARTPVQEPTAYIGKLCRAFDQFSQFLSNTIQRGLYSVGFALFCQ